MFLNALFLWRWEYQLSHKQHWTFELYVFVLSFAVVPLSHMRGDHAERTGQVRELSRLLLAPPLDRWPAAALQFDGFRRHAGEGEHASRLPDWPLSSRCCKAFGASPDRDENPQFKFHAVVILFIGQPILLAFRSYHTMQ
jgi:hypothetical protein